MSKTIVVTGASSGFGAMTVRALADAGHVVYAGIRDMSGRNKEAASAAADYARQHKVDLRALELDVSDDESVDAAIGTVISETGRLDVVVHNAGHMVLAPADAYPEEVARAIARVVDTPKGERASRVYIDPADDGAETVGRVADVIRADFYRRINLDDLLSPTAAPSAPTG